MIHYVFGFFLEFMVHLSGISLYQIAVHQAFIIRFNHVFLGKLFSWACNFNIKC